MTVHAAKGLEFPIVFVVGMEEELFPHINSLDNPADLEEERRACYVALTRAKRKLYLMAAARRMFFGQMKPKEISRFIKELPSDYVEYFGIIPQGFIKKKTSSPKSNYRAPTAHRAAQMKPAEKRQVSSTFLKPYRLKHSLKDSQWHLELFAFGPWLKRSIKANLWQSWLLRNMR